MTDEVHSHKVDAVESQSPLTDTESPCRSARRCIHIPENKQLKTVKNLLHEVTRKVRRQGKDLVPSVVGRRLRLFCFVGRLRGLVEQWPQESNQTGKITQRNGGQDPPPSPSAQTTSFRQRSKYKACKTSPNNSS